MKVVVIKGKEYTEKEGQADGSRKPSDIGGDSTCWGRRLNIEVSQEKIRDMGGVNASQSGLLPPRSMHLGGKRKVLRRKKGRIARISKKEV